MSFGLYRANSVVAIFGVVELKDMRADSFVNFRFDEEAFQVIKGGDGSITRYCTHNTLLHADHIFKRSSNVHQKLSAIHIADMQAEGGAGVAPYLCKDNQGGTIVSAEKAWIVGMPDAGFGKDVGADVTWVIDMQILPGMYIIGGNQIA